MKTKPITLILTLLFCLSGSVFAESYLSYKPLNNFNEITQKLSKLGNEIGEIRALLYDKRKSSGTSKNINNLEGVTNVNQLALALNDKNVHMYDILMYESVIIMHKIKNVKLVNTHKGLRIINFKSLNFKISHTRKYLKQNQIEIDNTTAVIAINSYLKILDELEEWYNKNKDFKIK